MARQPAQKLVSPAYQITVLLWLMCGVVKGFLVGVPRTATPTKHHEGSRTYTPVAVTRTRGSSATVPAAVADQLVPEEVGV